MDLTIAGYLAGLGILSLIAGKALGPVLIAIIQHFTARTKTTLDDRIFKEISGPIQSFFFVFVFVMGTHYLGVFNDAARVIDDYTTSIAIILVTYLLVNVAKAFFEWYEEEGIKDSRIKLDVTFLPLVRKIAQIFIAIIGLAMALAQVGFDVTGILAVTSVASVVVGLAAQETLGNIFAGMALQLDRPYYYGDYVKLSSGELVRLKKIGIRTTRLADMAGNTIVATNSEFAKQRVTRLTKGAKIASLAVPFEAPCEISPESLEKRIREGLTLGRFGIDDMGSVRIYVSKVKALGWYEANLIVHTKEPEQLALFADYANRIIFEMMEKARQGSGAAKGAGRKKR
ncbi:MAG: mechanosensitive ion channel family protein [Candidatus Micrarchaeia archaeon]